MLFFRSRRGARNACAEVHAAYTPPHAVIGGGTCDFRTNFSGSSSSSVYGPLHIMHARGKTESAEKFPFRFPILRGRGYTRAIFRISVCVCVRVRVCTSVCVSKRVCVYACVADGQEAHVITIGSQRVCAAAAAAGATYASYA